MGKICGAMLLSLAALSTPAYADQAADVAKILDAAIKASGGDALAKIKDVYGIAKFTVTQNGAAQVSFVEAWYEQNRQRTLTFDQNHLPLGIEVVNGDEGWFGQVGSEIPTMNAEMLAANKDQINATWASNLATLKGKEYKFSLLGDIDVNGHKAAGILVERAKYQPLKFYFDKQTHMFVKLQFKYSDVEPDKTTQYNQELTYSDFRDVGGIKTPFKIEVFWDGKKVGEGEMQKQVFYDKPQSDSLFNQP